MTDTLSHPALEDRQEKRPRRIALVASKGTLDQAYPPLILATTAASLGWEAGVYFTFYGLDIIHNDRLEKLKVASLANPAGPIQLPNLLGALPGARCPPTDVTPITRRPTARRRRASARRRSPRDGSRARRVG